LHTSVSVQHLANVQELFPSFSPLPFMAKQLSVYNYIKNGINC
jgi:hypothetical protein